VKLKLDENLPASAAPRLAALCDDVHTVLDESLGGKHDAKDAAAPSSTPSIVRSAAFATESVHRVQ
jgi:hypothetical protein